ncbi:MAG: hypothetical protein SZ59_C0001G0117 [candidate division TM6 bacterium GW2011_GWF2_28_16]|nr:MAG: hypothetical protein SZ59_C0001G0117 [candidate division TM6 bacterium GW2011_GWF2_28_16]
MCKIFSKKLKIFLAILFLTGLSVTGYFYFSKNISFTQEQSSFKFSHPDARPEIIPGKIITLKRLKPEYFKDYFEMANDPLVLKPLYWPAKLTLAWIKDYLEEEFEREKNKLTFIYMIFDNKENKLIGSAEIREPDPEDPGQFGCWINPKYWGGGRLQEAVKLLAQEYFKIYPNINKFNAHVEMWNLRSYFGLKKCGFKLVDTLHFKAEPSRYFLEYYKDNNTPVLNNSKDNILDPGEKNN